MRLPALASPGFKTTKRHAPTVIALAILIAAGVGACAELDAQDAAHAPKASPAKSDSPVAPTETAASAPSDSETLLDLTPVDPPHRSHRTMTPPIDPAAAPAAEIPSSPVTAPASTDTLAPSETTHAPDPTALAAPQPTKPAAMTRVESSLTFEVTSRIVPAAPTASSATSRTPSPAPIARATNQVLHATPSASATWIPRKPRLDANAWSVLGVAPLYPTARENPPTPIAHAPTPIPDHPPIEPIHAPTPIASTTPIPSTPVPATPDVHAPKPLGAEAPLKPIVVDVAPPLVLPSCLTQRPLPAAHAPAPNLPAPPTASVTIATAPKTGGPASSPLIPMLLLAATALALIATGGLAFIVSRSSSPENAGRRLLNIPTRLALAFGVVATIMLGACWCGAAAAASLGSQITFCILAAAAATLCVLGGLWVARSILTPLGACVESMRAIASGNLLAAPLNSTARHELGDLARAVDKLRAAMKDVVSEVSISSTEVAAAAHELATGAQGMAVAAGQLSSQCAVAGGDASSTGRLATSGGRSVQQATEEIARLDAFVRQHTQEVSDLADRNKHIARLVTLIDDISDRTHLIAMNASIEASKAGPEARSFSVLAEEVRRLAERSLKAVEEATATVRAVQDDTRSAAEKMSFASLQIKQGADMADRASHDLAEIIRTSGGVATSIQSISEAAEEAGAGAAQSASAAAQLCTRADDLKAMVARFRIDTSALMRHARPAVAAAPGATPSGASASAKAA